MREYDSIFLNNIVDQIKCRIFSQIEMSISEEDVSFLQYRLTRENYYAVIIDDYMFEINDKESLLEALYYQVRLLTMHDLNWDALHESLSDALDYFLEFEGICLLFKERNLKSKLSQEMITLNEIIDNINNQTGSKKINVLFNK